MFTYTQLLRSALTCLSVTLLTLSFVDAAHANLVKFALTAVVQQPTVEIRPGVSEAKLTRVRITNKELLKNYLVLAYPSAATPGARLGKTGSEFQILNSAGAVLDTVDTSVLKLEMGGTPVKDGIHNTSTGIFRGAAFRTGAAELQADGANLFAIEGTLKGKYFVRGPDQIFAFQLNMFGDGNLGGLNSFVFGTVKWIATAN